MLFNAEDILKYDFSHNETKLQELLEKLISNLEKKLKIELDQDTKNNLIEKLTTQLMDKATPDNPLTGEILLSSKSDFIPRLAITMNIEHQLDKAAEKDNGKDKKLINEFRKFAEDNKDLEPDQFAEKFKNTDKFNTDEKSKLLPLLNPILNQALKNIIEKVNEKMPENEKPTPSAKKDSTKKDKEETVTILTDQHSPLGEVAALAFSLNSNFPSPAPAASGSSSLIENVCNSILTSNGGLNMTVLNNLHALGCTEDEMNDFQIGKPLECKPVGTKT